MSVGHGSVPQRKPTPEWLVYARKMKPELMQELVSLQQQVTVAMQSVILLDTWNVGQFNDNSIQKCLNRYQRLVDAIMVKWHEHDDPDKDGVG